MSMLKTKLYGALNSHYQAKKSKALFQLQLSFENPVAIDEVAGADESIQTLESYFGDVHD